VLQQAIAYVEEAIRIRRDLGLQANVATSLNNASSFYSELAGLETTREGRARVLQQAIAYVEEAIRIRRDLGLQADIAVSLGTANICYRAMSETVANAESQIHLLQKALHCIEEAVDIFRALGIVRYLALALRHAVITHLQLGELTTPALARIEVLCEEGEALCTQMGDDDGKTFFHNNVRHLLRRNG
jgi:tetratricopeptide (TPR) repeat protein